MRRLLWSSQDKRLLRRAARITLFLWSLILVTSLAGTILPFLVAGRLASADTVTAAGNGIGVAVVFGSLLGGASFFLPERPMPAFGRFLFGLISIMLGSLAFASTVALVLASDQFGETGGAWVLAGVAAVLACLGVFLSRDGYRALTYREPGPRFGRG